MNENQNITSLVNEPRLLGQGSSVGGIGEKIPNPPVDGRPSKEFLAALVALQQDLKAALKDAQNPHFKSTYADLESVWEACREACGKHGFFWTAVTVFREDGTYLRSSLWHAKTGEEHALLLPLLNPAKTMQGLGSAITYARRYGLQTLAGICPEDDDGNAAGGQGGAPGKQRGAQTKGNASNEEKKGISLSFTRMGPATEMSQADWKKKRVTAKQIETLRAGWQEMEKSGASGGLGGWSELLLKGFGKKEVGELTQGEASQLISYFSSKLKKDAPSPDVTPA